MERASWRFTQHWSTGQINFWRVECGSVCDGGERAGVWEWAAIFLVNSGTCAPLTLSTTCPPWDRQTDRRSERQTDRWIERWRDRRTYIQIDRCTTHTVTHTHTHTVSLTHTHTHTHTHTQSYYKPIIVTSIHMDRSTATSYIDGHGCMASYSSK